MSTSDLAISVRGLSKAYTIRHDGLKRPSFREAVVEKLKHPLRKPRTETFWALNDVSFEVKKGDVVGIIGRNGAGKSTLLKILSRIVEPTTGEVDMYGRVGSLLEVGTGFHSELTGRENIYLNGAILGMRKQEIRRQFDAIVDFAEVDKFLDTPVKRYSSGMYVRLAFAVAAHLNPEILIVDEVLAVGDAQFQNKCLGKMKQVSEGQGRTVLFVSHNMAAMSSLCKTGVMLGKGEVIEQGDMQKVVQAYVAESNKNTSQDLDARTDRQGSQAIKFSRIKMRNQDGRSIGSFMCGQPAIIRLEYRIADSVVVRNLKIAVGIDNQSGHRIAHLGSETSGDELQPNSSSHGLVDIVIDKMPLMPGNYAITLFATVNGEIADWIQSAGTFNVEAGDYFGTGRVPAQGSFIIDHRFELVSPSSSAS